MGTYNAKRSCYDRSVTIYSKIKGGQPMKVIRYIAIVIAVYALSMGLLDAAIKVFEYFS